MDRHVSRRTVLAGAAGLVGTTGLISVKPAYAGPGFPDPGLVTLRRDLHRHPEPPGQEKRTAEMVARRLRAAGLKVSTGVGGYGVVGVLTGGADRGRTVAYRADMDAVPPSDQIEGGPELAHVCGHDLHTAIGVGIAERLARSKHRLRGNVVFFFQPAEEALAGAASMLDAGVLERFRPTEIHALHCAQFPVGQFAVTPGFGLPGQDRGVITLTGSDATVRAQRLTTDIQALGTVTQSADAADLEKIVADVQRPDSPLAEFVAMRAAVTTGNASEVRVSYRCWPENRYVDIRDDINRLAQAHGPASVSFPGDPFPAMVCPEPQGQAIERYLQRTLGRDRVVRMHAALPFSGEDFALFLDRIPGTYTFLGVRSPGACIKSSHPHFGSFTPDERAIKYAVDAMTGWLALRARLPVGRDR